MISSARPTVPPIANIISSDFSFARFEKWGQTYVRTNRQTTCVKTIIPTDLDCWLAEWINSKNLSNIMISLTLFQSHQVELMHLKKMNQTQMAPPPLLPEVDFKEEGPSSKSRWFRSSKDIVLWPNSFDNRLSAHFVKDFYGKH